MSDYMTQSLADLRKSIVADGVVDADEAKKLRERLYADGKIDQAEAEFIFDVNDAVSGNANDPAWQTLFVDTICDYLLKDETSPGVVDGAEAVWLLERVQPRDVVGRGTEKVHRFQLMRPSTAIRMRNGTCSVPQDARTSKP